MPGYGRLEQEETLAGMIWKNNWQWHPKHGQLHGRRVVHAGRLVRYRLGTGAMHRPYGLEENEKKGALQLGRLLLSREGKESFGAAQEIGPCLGRDLGPS